MGLGARGPRGDSIERGLPVAEPLGARSLQGASSHPRWGLNVGATEDDDQRVHRPQTGIDEQNDALDDACHVRYVYPGISQWPGPLLGGIQYDRDSAAVQGIGVGQLVPGLRPRGRGCQAGWNGYFKGDGGPWRAWN